MSDPTGNGPQDDQPQQQPPPYPPPQQNPYGQPPQQPAAPQQPDQQPDQHPDQHPAQPFGQPQYGQPPQGHSQQQGYGQPAYGQPPAYGQTYRDPDKRPTTVTVAGVITLALSGLVLVLLVLLLAALSVARDEVVAEMRDQSGLGDIDPNDLVSVLFVVFVAFIVWCIVAMVLAVFAMRRSNGARIGLVVSSALAATFYLLTIAAIFTVIPLIACIAVIVCLFAGGASEWYKGTNASSGRSGIAPPVA